MTVGFFSPLPPARTGVADYSAALLTHMRKLGDVQANTPGDANLYHLGNNHLHREIYARALAQPGIVVLHDAVLQHFFLGTLSEAAYVEEFVLNYGDERLARELWKNRARSGADPRYFGYPMLKRIATTSRAVIVHNPAAAEVVRRHAPQIPIAEIPHLFLKPPVPSEQNVASLRKELGLEESTILTGIFGHLRESKRLPVILRALDRVTDKNVRLLVQGEFASTDLERAMRGKLEPPRILRRGFLEDRDFWRYAAATDLCINLRFPSAGETSGIAISMMGIGKPVVFTAGREIANFPDNACLRVELGPTEEEHLSGLLVWASKNRDALKEIGLRAAKHIQTEHDPDKVARQFWDVLKKY
jgi:glycosyltransferase involved in cell wall biosynthesis